MTPQYSAIVITSDSSIYFLLQSNWQIAMLEPDQGLLQRERTYVSYKYAIYNESKTISVNIENC